MLAEGRSLEQLLEDIHDAVAADESHRSHGRGHLLHHGALSEGVERRDEVRLKSLRLVDDGLDLSLELLKLDLLVLASDDKARLIRVRLDFGLDGRDFRPRRLRLELVRDLLGLRASVGLDHRQVELELELGRLGLQRHRGALRLRLCHGDLTLQVLRLLRIGKVTIGLGEVEGVLDDLALRAHQKLLDVRVLHRHTQDLEVIDAHAVFREGEAVADCLLALDFCRQLAQHDISEDVGAAAVELLYIELLHRVADLGPHVIAEELDVVVDVEPASRIAFEADSVAQLDVEATEVAGLDFDDVGHHVSRRLEEDRAKRAVHRLRLATRERDDLRGLVVLEHEGARSLDDTPLARLPDEQHSEPGPDGRLDSAVVLRVEHDRTGSRELVLPIEGVARKRLGRAADHHPTIGTRVVDHRGGRRVGRHLASGIKVTRATPTRCEIDILDAESLRVDRQSLFVARIDEFAELQIESPLSDDLTPRIGKEDLRAADETDDSRLAIEDVSCLACRDGDAVVQLLVTVLDDGVLLTGEVDGLLLASDEKLVSRGVLDAGVVRVVRDDADVDAASRSELLRAELLRLRRVRVGLDGCLDELLRRLREDDVRSVHVALVTVLIEQEAVLQALEGDGLTHVALLAAHLLGDDLEAGGRDVEGDVDAADNEELAHRQVLLGRDVKGRLGRFELLGSLGRGRRGLTLAADVSLRLDDGLAPVRLRGFLVVDADEQVFVAAEVVTLDDLRHLAGPEWEGDRARDVDLLSDSKRRSRQLPAAPARKLVVFRRVLEDDVPALGSRLEGLRSVSKADGTELLALVVEDDWAVRACQARLVGTHEDRDITLRLVRDEGVLVRCQDHVPLAAVGADVVDFVRRCHVAFLFRFLPLRAGWLR